MTYSKAKSHIYIDNYKKHFFKSGIAYPIFVCILTGNHNFYDYMPAYLQVLSFILLILSISNYDKWKPDKNIRSAIIANDAQRIISLANRNKWQVNVVSLDGGFTPLHWACNSSEDEIVLLLLELGANPNAISNEKGTPVHWAVSKSNLIKLGYLIQYGANLDIHDGKGRTPLHWAVLYNSLPTVTFLVEHGADRTICDVDGKTPLELSRSKSEWEHHR
jgi:ankyrin repeat protein